MCQYYVKLCEQNKDCGIWGPALMKFSLFENFATLSDTCNLFTAYGVELKNRKYPEAW